jgi:hypothetical protein
MQPRIIGRVLGIGVRVAGRVAGQRIASSAVSATAGPVSAAATRPRDSRQPAERFAARAGQSASQSMGGVARNFRRVGGILWLEVTGAFFLLPAIVFAPTLWKAGVGYAHTSDHRIFWTSALVVTVFVYLSVSSFWRARRR